MFPESVQTFAVGDRVRVRAALRRDRWFEVSAIFEDGRVLARNDKGGEALYNRDAFERCDRVEIGEPVEVVADPDSEVADLDRPARAVMSSSRDDDSFEPLASFYRDSATIWPRHGESAESVARRFKKAVERAGVIGIHRSRRHFQAENERRRVKSRRARARLKWSA